MGIRVINKANRSYRHAQETEYRTEELLMPSNKNYITVRIEPELRDRLKAIAEREHRSLAAQARLMIYRAIQKEEGTNA